MSSQDIIWDPLLGMQKSQLTFLSDTSNSYNTNANGERDSVLGDSHGEGNFSSWLKAFDFAESQLC